MEKITNNTFCGGFPCAILTLMKVKWKNKCYEGHQNDVPSVQNQLACPCNHVTMEMEL